MDSSFGSKTLTNRGDRKRVTLAFFSSIYHPVDVVKHKEFNKVLHSFISAIPISYNFVGVNDVNANLGIRSKSYTRALGPHGLNNQYAKGRKIIQVFSTCKLNVSNSFFQKPSYTNWRNFSKSRSPHILDVISVS